VKSAPPEAVVHPSLESLVPTLQGETARVLELRDALLRQRDHVARQDTAAIQSGADEIASVLMALDTAQRERTRTVALLASDPGTPLAGLAARLGVTPPPAFERARLELERAAAQARREAAINHEVLRRAVESGEAFLQALFSSVGDGPATYGPDGAADAAASGVFVNRRA
jgi:hypothetical protein